MSLTRGMAVEAFDEDTDENGKRDDLIAAGTVEPPAERARRQLL